MNVQGKRTPGPAPTPLHLVPPGRAFTLVPDGDVFMRVGTNTEDLVWPLKTTFRIVVSPDWPVAVRLTDGCTISAEGSRLVYLVNANVNVDSHFGTPASHEALGGDLVRAMFGGLDGHEGKIVKFRRYAPPEPPVFVDPSWS